MILENLFPESLSLIGSLNLYVAAYLFLICLIPETIGFSFPYLLETTWLLAGYQFSVGVLSFPSLLLYVLVAEGGREVGAYILYSISAAGSPVIGKYFSRFMPKPSDKSQDKNVRFRLFRQINLLSSFSAAIGRLLWLRIPITIVLGARHKLRTLVIGILLSSAIWDATYIALGAFAGTTIIAKPLYLVLFFLAVVALSYLMSLLIKLVIRLIFSHRLSNVSMTDRSSTPDDK